MVFHAMVSHDRFPAGELGPYGEAFHTNGPSKPAIMTDKLHGPR